jgi:2-iminobutanoate/2-iminopropanoate deaminase
VKHQIVAFPGSPPALGPYSLGVMAEGKFLFVSGMTPFDPEAGKIDRTSISRQTELVLENIKNVLGAGGVSLADVVSCRVYLSNLTAENFREMNEVYARYFGESKPARATTSCDGPNQTTRAC